ncbi:MAG: hypothetical protein KGP28_03785 [Bdellovibrionales bacterium]|nr:hypothetical protein [Bdellovibrionales bacterium]
MNMKAIHWTTFFIVLFSFSKALAATEVSFTPKELAAGYVLLRPELNSIELHGNKGTFKPSPALRFFGIEDQIFEINFSPIIDLVDLEFNHLRADAPMVRFSNGSLDLIIPLQDQDRALKSRLGSISIQGASLIAQLGWRTHADGVQELELMGTRFEGEMSGSGVLCNDFILRKTKKFLLNLLSRQVRQILKNPMVTESVREGLIAWARFSLGYRPHEVVPASIRIDPKGLHYEIR